jgi:hypothetical protein
MYHLRVARDFRLIASNVLWFDWCGYVYAESCGTYDLSIFLRNVAVAGALARAWQLGNENGALWWAGRVVRLPLGPSKEMR